MGEDKESRGGFGRFGLGRAGSESEGKEQSGSGPKTAVASGKSGRPAAKPDVVAAPAVSDGAESAAPARAPLASPAAAARAAAASTEASAPAASTASSAPPAAPAKSTMSAPAAATSSVATATRPDRDERKTEKVTFAKSDAPIPKSRLGRTKGADAVRAPRVRRARLKIANIDPWSVMKVAFLFSVALGIIFLVAVALLWALLDFMGFFNTVATTVSDISGDEGTQGFDVVGFFSLPRVLGMATIIALVDTVVITALATLAAYLYNISTDLVGGVEVTLAEEE
ncbi:MAG: DUF3566 domain-containing protein [Sporichthyaceae bacterium]